MPQTVTRRSFLSLATAALAVRRLGAFATTTDPLVYRLFDPQPIGGTRYIFSGFYAPDFMRLTEVVL
jgi:hypothetical protein